MLRSAMLACLLLIAPAQALDMYFEGTGGVIVGSDVDQTVGAEEPLSNYAITLEGPGDDDTLFIAHGSWNPDSDEIPFGPTFIYDGDDGPVTLVGAEPIFAVAYVDHRVGGVCPVVAQIFDGAGNLLGPEGGVESREGVPGPGIVESSFEFTGIAGTFPSLKVQFVTSGVDCGLPGAEVYWGSADHPSRLMLGAGDYVGDPPVEAAGPEQYFVNITDDAASIEHRLNGTSDSYHFNWTSASDVVNVTYDVTVAAGSAHVMVHDAEGVVLDREFTEDNSSMMQLEAVRGAWTIQVNYTDFDGTLSMDIVEAVTASEPEDGGSGPEDGGDGMDGMDGTDGMEDDDAPPDEDTPFIAIPLVLALLVWFARRR